ncbi:PH domain-containing protein [Mycobacterium sp. NPDC050853]|uniref:PH domain-containing protein n=1 Tax=Mycobacteriaceae TaxID=1762 RepID=UPI0015DDE0EB|nr:PH domain-containing protein [Mycobacteroides sp. LB1]
MIDAPPIERAAPAGFGASRSAPVLWAVQYALASTPLIVMVAAVWTGTALPAHATTAMEHLVAVLGLLCLSCAVAWVVLRPLQRYRTYRWGVLDDNLAYVASKTLWQKSLWVIPLALVRTVELRQDPLSRVFGLAAVRVRADQGELRIVGIDADTARQVVEWLFAGVDEASVH